MKKIFGLFLSLLSLFSCSSLKEEVKIEKVQLVSISFNGKVIPLTKVPTGVSGDVEYVLTFTKNLDFTSFNSNRLTCSGASLSDFDLYVNGEELHIKSNTTLPYFKTIASLL